MQDRGRVGSKYGYPRFIEGGVEAHDFQHQIVIHRAPGTSEGNEAGDLLDRLHLPLRHGVELVEVGQGLGDDSVTVTGPESADSFEDEGLIGETSSAAFLSTSCFTVSLICTASRLRTPTSAD